MRIYPSSLILLLVPSSTDAFTPHRYNVGWRADTTTITHQWKILQPKIPMQYPSKVSSQLNVIADNGGDEQITEEGVGNLLSTVSKLKADVDEASYRATIAEERVLNIQTQLSEAEKELKEKERLLQEGGNFWDQEKENFLDQIAEFTRSLQLKDSESEAATDAIKQKVKERQEALEKEIVGLKHSLNQAEVILNEEKERGTAIMSRLLSAEDTLEYEQMEYQSLKLELDKRIIEEKSKLILVKEEKKDLKLKMKEDLSRLVEVQAQMESVKKSFEDEKRKFEEQIQGGIKIRQLKAAQMSSRYEKVRKEMTALWVGAKNDARKEKKKLTGTIKERDGLIEQLEKDLAEAKSTKEKLSIQREEMMQQRNNASKEQSEIEAKLSSLLEESNRTILGFKEEIFGLQTDEAEYKKEINFLLKQIEEKESKRLEIESLFENEKNLFKEEISKLEDQVEDSAKELQMKAKSMNKKFNDMKKEMAAPLDTFKRSAQKEERQLRKKYDGILTKRNDSICRLEDELSSAKLFTDGLSNQRQDMQLQRDKARTDVTKLDVQLIERNQLVSNLKKEVSEQDETISEYESSYRKMMQLSLKLTKTRLRNLVSRKKDAE